MKYEITIDLGDVLFITAGVLFIIALMLGVQRLSRMDVQPWATGTKIACAVRRILRRGSWYYLFPVVVLLYKPFYNFMLNWNARGLLGKEADDAIAAAAAKMVDPTQFYSKSWIAFSNFCQINAMGWGSLLVIPVLVDWAVGFYTEPQGTLPIVPGFKRTFLELQGRERMAFYLVVWISELFLAAHSVDSGFRMQ